MSRFARLVSVIGLTAALLPARLQAQPSPPAAGDLSGARYQGAVACARCHADLFEAFRRTAHHRSSGLVSADAILGSFGPGRATLRTRNPNLKWQMSARSGSFYQTAVIADSTGVRRLTAPMHIIIGSGKIAQTYLYWQGKALYQAPVSYLTASDSWINSPGYRDGAVNFDRGIFPRCLECHATTFQSDSYDSNRYESYVLGISCERCHGPGSTHIAYHEGALDAPADPLPDLSAFDRRQAFDLCGQCHYGIGEPTGRPFSYLPGRPLSDYVRFDLTATSDRPTVHASGPYVRLSMSACFKQSDSISCLTCHDPHAHERGRLAAFDARCLTCHDRHPCGLAAAERHDGSCVSCHMPVVQDPDIAMQMPGGFKFIHIRDHHIRILPEAGRGDVSPGRPPSR